MTGSVPPATPTVRLPPVGSQADRVAVAVATVRAQWNKVPQVGVILGTGLGQLASSITRDTTIRYESIPHFPRSTAIGHAGQFVCGELADVPVIAMEGRFHFYEGYQVDDITLPVKVMAALGAQLLVVSNASGGLNPQFRSGEIMALADHLDWMGRRTASLGVRDHSSAFPPSRRGTGKLYDPQLLDWAQEVARCGGFACHLGTYVAVLGPNYETRSEYRAMRKVGGDAVGMSTVPEALAAARLGMRVLALSTVTNVAKPDAPSMTEAQEVIDIAATAEPRLRSIVLGVLAKWRSLP